jgi:hypothetical protein
LLGPFVVRGGPLERERARPVVDCRGRLLGFRTDRPQAGLHESPSCALRVEDAPHYELRHFNWKAAEKETRVRLHGETAEPGCRLEHKGIGRGIEVQGLGCSNEVRAHGVL